MTFTLAANVENLTLTGSAAINGTGNTLANVITGNTAGNRLDGGAGNDSLLGGLGDDVYVVDSTSDVVTENANGGTDLVQSSVTFTLAANVENLTLDRRRQHQRHRQCPWQHPRRQHRQQYPEWRRRRR